MTALSEYVTALLEYLDLQLSDIGQASFSKDRFYKKDFLKPLYPLPCIP